MDNNSLAHTNLKSRYGNRHFWCRGYNVDTVGRNKERIVQYIREQLREYIANDFAITILSERQNN